MTKEDIKQLHKKNLPDLNIKKEIDPYDQKIKTYFIKIAIEIILILCLIGGIFLFKQMSKSSCKNHDKKISNINNNISRLQIDTKNIEGKVAEVRSYKAKWDNSSLDLMGLKAMKENYLKDKIRSLSSKYKIDNLVITNKSQQKANIKSLNLQTLYLNSTTGNIRFSALTDLDGIDFIADVVNSLSGFFIISKMSISKKQEKYISKNILKIKQGEGGQFIIDFNIDYTWYAIKRK